MTFQDMNDDRVYTLSDIHDEWLQGCKDEPWNHAETFFAEMFVLLMDTINGRNDLNILYMTPHEVSGMIARLGRKVGIALC